MNGAAMTIGIANIVTSARNSRKTDESQVRRLAEDVVGSVLVVDRDGSCGRGVAVGRTVIARRRRCRGRAPSYSGA